MSIEYRHGSSPGVLADLPPGCATAVICDPPYGLDRGYGRADVARKNGRAHGIANDAGQGEIMATSPLVARLLAEDGVALVFAAPQYRRHVEAILELAGLECAAALPWDKGAPGLSYRVRYAYEEVVLAVHPGYDPWETRETIIVPVRYPKEQFPEHPNEKPVGLLRIYTAWACPRGGLVVDPFAGIASGALAALGTGCDWIGAECDPQWWPIAERRIAEALDQPHYAIEQQNLFTRTTEDTVTATERSDKVLEFLRNDIASNGGTTVAPLRKISAATGIAPGTVQATLKRLEASGVIQRAENTEGRAYAWRVVA